MKEYKVLDTRTGLEKYAEIKKIEINNIFGLDGTYYYLGQKDINNYWYGFSLLYKNKDDLIKDIEESKIFRYVYVVTKL